jgi:hypothetical protein
LVTLGVKKEVEDINPIAIDIKEEVEVVNVAFKIKYKI